MVKHTKYNADDDEFYAKTIYFRELIDCYKYSEEYEKEYKNSTNDFP